MRERSREGSCRATVPLVPARHICQSACQGAGSSAGTRLQRRHCCLLSLSAGAHLNMGMQIFLFLFLVFFFFPGDILSQLPVRPDEFRARV